MNFVGGLSYLEDQKVDERISIKMILSQVVM
jgi:hypothetical protein